jgi:Flp pilus assembly protein TadG
MRDINKKSPERGAALVELAIVLPLLLLILMGIIEFGLLFYNQQVLTNSSREGARAGIALTGKALIDKNIDTTLEFVNEVDSVVQNYCQQHFITFNTVQAVDTTVAGALSTYPAELTVNVNYTYTFLVPDLLDLNTSMQLSASTVMNMERTLN